MRDKHEQTLTVTLPDRGSRDSSFLNLDTDDLQASLGGMDEMLQSLDQQLIESDGAMITLDDDLASVNGNLSLLDMSGQNLQLLDSPEIQKAMRQAQQMLQGLEICSDPI
jgi:hypothetical protein